MTYILGVDLGTSSLKGSIYTEEGCLVESSSSSYDLITPKRGYSEQDPDSWIKAFFEVIFDLEKKIEDLKDELVALSFSGQMHSLVLLDKDNKPLRNAILWNDVRTSDQCREIMEGFGEELISISKNIALEGFTLPKILRVKENEPEIWEKTAHILLPKDYLRLKLTGKYNMDYSDAAGTLLLDIENRVWSQDILKKYEISPSLLPDLVDSIAYVGDILPDIREHLGLKRNIKIYAGAADNAASALGAGIIKSGFAMASIGTSGVVLANKQSLSGKENGNLHTFNSAIPSGYYSMGVTLAAGKSLDWLKSIFAEDNSFDEFLIDIDKIGPGSDGLLFTPYIQGERSPYNDGKIRGSFIGLDINTTRDHIIRATLEGITYSLKDSLTIMEDEGLHIEKIVSVGGGSKNKIWLQMQADIFNKEVVNLELENGPATGAAMIAAVGSGIYDSFEDCAKRFVAYKENFIPNVENVGVYSKYYELYKSVYPSTRDICHSLGDII